MATYEQIMQAARNADAAGDTESAKRLIQMAQDARPVGGVSTNSQAVDQFGGKMRALGRGFAEGATYGFVDEASAGLGAALGMTPGSAPFDYSGSFGDRYQVNRDAIRDRQSQSSQQNPMQFGIGEIAGGTAQALATAPIATAPTLAGTMARGGLLGAIEGGLYGAGRSDGQDTVGNAVRGAGIGAGVGFVAPAVVSAAATARDALTGGIDNVLDRASQGRAARSVAETVRRSGQSADDITNAVARAQASGQPMYMAVDAMGDAGRRRLSGIVRSGGDNSAQIAEYLRQRTIDAPDRLAAFTDEAFGLQGKTRAVLEGQVKGNRKAVADALYSRAAKDAKPVDVRQTVSMLDDTISQMTGSGMNPPDVVAEFQKLRGQLAGMTAKGEPTTLSDYKSVLAVWRQVRDKVDSAFKSGSGETHIAEALVPVRDALQESLIESSDLFSSANQLYRRGSEVLGAFDTGAQFATRGRADDNIRIFNSLSDQEQRAARIGYGDEIIRRIEGMNAEAPNVSRQMASTKRKAEATAMAFNPEQYAARIAREGDMFKTFNTALGGSRTADNLNDIADVGAIADLSRAGIEGARGNAAGTVTSLFSAVRPLLQGQNAATQQLVANALLSRDPGAILARAVQTGQISETMRRTIEGMIRSYSRAASERD